MLTIYMCRFEVVLLVMIYLAYGYNEGGALGYILLTISSWFMALSWLFALVFNPSSSSGRRKLLFTLSLSNKSIFLGVCN